MTPATYYMSFGAKPRHLDALLAQLSDEVHTGLCGHRFEVLLPPLDFSRFLWLLLGGDYPVEEYEPSQEAEELAHAIVSVLDYDEIWLTIGDRIMLYDARAQDYIEVDLDDLDFWTEALQRNTDEYLDY